MAEPVDRFASRLAPTGIVQATQIHCGSEPAREGGNTNLKLCTTQTQCNPAKCRHESSTARLLHPPR
ncbi:hypothetical protein C1X64_10365 [Pseudomonas sp. GW456-E7]|nr:hypothetical protein C1X64_10365 [Pseudomonas sp. GW456-E7]